MMEHKGYQGECAVDLDAGLIRGQVVGLRDVITFQGQTVAEARDAFIDSVDDYLEFCTQRGEDPEPPVSGRLLLELPPQMHRSLVDQARAAGLTLDAFVLARLA